jgi:PKD repeat protein
VASSIAELESDYNVTRLEPVIVGPDFTEEEAMADVDDALRNVDNVYVMDDGRVLCCEDGWRGGNRSYPNDGLYVYQPPVVVEPASAAVAYDESVEVDVTASSLPAGLSGAKLSVSVSHGDVAEITDASYADSLDLTATPSISGDGSTVELEIADINDEIQPGDTNVTLATLELDGTGGGTTDLVAEVEAMDDEEGTAIDVQGRTGVLVVGPPPVGSGSGGKAPTDPDGDGTYEDVNGNGRMDYDDVVLLFENLDEDAVELNVDAYDFNDNGRIDYDDVVDLYEEI